jgi:hypothetical protein
MDDNFDVYISRCLKNWAAKRRPLADSRIKLLQEAGYPPLEEPTPLTRFFSSFANRWDAPGEQLYNQRHWQLGGPIAHSTIWSFHLVLQQKMVP